MGQSMERSTQRRTLAKEAPHPIAVRRAVTALLLAGMLACGAAPLAAQGLTVKGRIDAGFGQRQLGDGSRVWDPVGAAAVEFTARLGEFTALVEIGVTEDSAFDYGQHRITWRPAGQVALSFSGAAPELPGVDGFLGVLAGEGTGAPGDPDVFFDYSDAGLFTLDVGGKAFTFGLAVSDICVPECGANGAGTPATRERNTFILSVRGQAGSVKWQAYGADSQGRYANGTEGSGSGAGGSVEYRSGSLRLAADVAAGRTNCVAGCTDAIESTNRGVALVAGGFGAQFALLSRDEGPGARTDVNTLDVVYHFAADPGVVYGPQYSAATTDDGVTKTTERFAFFVVAAEF